MIVTVLSSKSSVLFCYEEGQTSQPRISEQDQILLTLFRSCYRLGLLNKACILFIHEFMVVQARFGMSYQKPYHLLSKKLANTHVSITVEKQIKAHLFQQQTQKHCCSFLPLSKHSFLQQSSSCKIVLWKSCVPSLNGLMNVLPKQTAATQMLVTVFEDVTTT